MKIRKLVFFLTFVISTFFISFNDVHAVEYDCSSKAINELRNLAYNVVLTYDLYETYNETGSYYFYVNLDNLNEKFYVSSNNSYETTIKNGYIEKYGKFPAGNTYTFQIISSSLSSCPGQILYTRRIEFPHYNDFSIREECMGVEGLSLCDKWTAKPDITEEEFIKRVNEYKESLNKDDIEEKEELSTIDKFIQLYKDNLIISISITILLIVIIILIIRKIIKNKKKIKIKI